MFKKILNNTEHYIVLQSLHKVNLSKKLIKIINNEKHLFVSGTPTIIELPNNEFLINLRWINYNLNSKLRSIVLLNDKVRRVDGEIMFANIIHV